MSIVDVLSMDRDMVIQALGSGFNDFEDALQNYSTIISGFIDVILTRNSKDFFQKWDRGGNDTGKLFGIFRQSIMT